MSLWDQLLEILPKVLPADPAQALSGTELIAKVRPLLKGDYKDTSLRQHFSDLSGDATTPIAKRAGKQGYFLRPTAVEPPAESATKVIEGVIKVTPAVEGTLEVQPADPVAELALRNKQPEEKFRAFFIRHQELNNRFPMHVEHSRAKKAKAGMDKWKFPDVIVVQWEAGKAADEGYRLDPQILRVRESLGEQPFRLTSVELKDDVSTGDFREAFFQCVSNSRWAHRAVLAIAAPIQDATLQTELRRLGASYDVTVLSYSLDRATLDGFPPANEILDMELADFEMLFDTSKAEVATVAAGRDRDALDWEHLADMRNKAQEFVDLFNWLAGCLDDQTAYPFSGYQERQENLKKADEVKVKFSGRNTSTGNA